MRCDNTMMIHFCKRSSLKGKEKEKKKKKTTNNLFSWLLNFAVTFGNCSINLNEERTSLCYCCLWRHSDVTVQQEREDPADNTTWCRLFLWATTSFLYLLICLQVFALVFSCMALKII